MTQGVATTFNLRIGDLWHQGGKVRQVTGIVQNPQSLLDEFALVVPGQVSTPSQVTVLFTAPPGMTTASLGSLSQDVVTRHGAVASNPLNPETIVLATGHGRHAAHRPGGGGGLHGAGAAPAALAGHARRRGRHGQERPAGGPGRRARWWVSSARWLGGGPRAWPSWLAYRPRVEASAHHVIGAFQLPWGVIGRGDGAGRGGHLLSPPPRPGPRGINPGPDRRRPVRAARSAAAGPPLGGARRRRASWSARLLLWYSGKSSNGGGSSRKLVGWASWRSSWR